MALQVVDAHFHLWDRSSGNYGEPRRSAPGQEADPTESNYFMDQFLDEGAGEIELCGAVHVEALARDPLAELAFVEAQLSRAELATAIIARTDLTSAGIAKTLEQLQVASPKVRGVRQILNRHSDPGLNFAGRDLLSDPAWADGLAVLSDKDMSFDLQIYPHQVQQVANILDRLPRLNCVLDHAGMWADRSFSGWQEWKAGLARLSKLPNMRVKISGLGKFDQHWTVESYRPLVYEVIEHFGSTRVMFASNFPIEKRAAEYVGLWQAFEEILVGVNAEARHQMLVGTAWDFYRLGNSK